MIQPHIGQGAAAADKGLQVLRCKGMKREEGDEQPAHAAARGQQDSQESQEGVGADMQGLGRGKTQILGEHLPADLDGKQGQQGCRPHGDTDHPKQPQPQGPGTINHRHSSAGHAAALLSPPPWGGYGLSLPLYVVTPRKYTPGACSEPGVQDRWWITSASSSCPAEL